MVLTGTPEAFQAFSALHRGRALCAGARHPGRWRCQPPCSTRTSVTRGVQPPLTAPRASRYWIQRP